MDRNLYLLPFQERGAEWLAGEKRGMLAWDMGVGKTPTAVKACELVRATRVLVLCPPIVTQVWRTHFRDWSNFIDIRVLKPVDATMPYSFLEGGSIVRIVPYSYLGREPQERLLNALVKFSNTWDVIILDECHNLKNPQAKRTQAVYGRRCDLLKSICEDAKHIWALSGTPMLNNAGELWTHFRALRPDLISFSGKVLDEDFFIDRYCVSLTSKYGRRITGVRNSNDLAERARKFMHRRRLRDVLPELPELRIVTHDLPPDTPINDDLRDQLEEVTEALDIDFEGADDDQLLAAVQSGNVAFSSARRLIGLAKAPGVAELAANDLEGSDGKLILFAHHREVIAELSNALIKYNPLIVHGGVSKAEAAKRVETFQTNDAYRLIIMAIDIAEGIGLFAAHNVLIAEPSPVPARNAQAIARAHRKGQKNPVLARFVLLPGTIDHRLMSIIARKTRDVMRVIDPDLAGTPVPTQTQLFTTEERI